MRGRLAASLGWRLISLAEKDLTTSSNCSGKQTRGVILKLLLSKKDSLSDKKACLVFPQLHPWHIYMHLNSYLQTRFLAVPSRSRRLIFTHISKFSISALVILHSVHEMTASSRCSKDSQINLCTFLESDVSLCSVGLTNSPFSFTEFTFASVFPSLYALWSAFPNQNDCIKELCDSCFNKNSPLLPHDIPLLFRWIDG